MAFLIIMPGHEADAWVRHIQKLTPGIDLRVWPDAGDPGDIEFVLSWNHPAGDLMRYPNLKCIASMGAGVDHILRDPDLPPAIPITRIVDTAMAASMSEYLVMAALNFIRYSGDYRLEQTEAAWSPRIPRMAGDTPVGIMGMGHLGRSAAAALRAAGFPVAGWRQFAGPVDGVTVFHGSVGRVPFLEKTHLLVNLLPLTGHTRDILNSTTFSHLRPGAYLINAARGEHLVEADLLDAIAVGQLSGACLDVFREEPLPDAHPFWDHPAVTITPHVASLTNPKAVLPRILENHERVLAGQPPLDPIDRQKGY